MSLSESQETRTETVGIFENAGTLQEAIDELLSSGFNRAEVSLLASEQAVEEKLGHAYEKAVELDDDTSVPRAAYISTESRGDAEGGIIGGLVYVGAVAATGAVVASGGTLAVAIAAAALVGGAGALIGAVLAKLIEVHHADYLQEQLNHGGLLLWVRTRDKEHERRAIEILSKHSAHDVHTHHLAAVGG